MILFFPRNYSFECDQSRNYDLSSHRLKHVNFRLQQRWTFRALTPDTGEKQAL